MALLTTTIGSYPKPDYVPVANWHSIRQKRGAHPTHPTRAYDSFLADMPPDAEERLDRGTQEIVREQVEAGIDVPTDGEIRREHYIYYHCRHLYGFDFDGLTEKAMRGGSWTAHVPTVRGPIEAGPPFLPRDWQVAQAVTDRPIKITIPGPLTIIDSTADAYYGDEAALAAALGEAINAEIKALAEAGCRWIQVDEPLFAREPDRALAFGVDALARCFHDVPGSVKRAVHICCGYPAELDLEDYPKADPDVYFRLSEAIDRAPVEAVSLEDAHRHNDLGLLERFERSSVILGVIAIARSQVESVDEVRERLKAALEHIDANRLIAGPDCGLTMLPRETARAKLAVLSQAARSVG